MSEEAAPRDLALVALAALCFATSSPLAKAAHHLSPFAIGSGRCVVASLAITLIFPRKTFVALAALSARGRVRLLGAGALLAAHFGCFLFGLAHTSLSAAASLVSLEPLAVVLGACSSSACGRARTRQSVSRSRQLVRRGSVMVPGRAKIG